MVKRISRISNIREENFCSSNECKMECPPEKIRMNIDEDFMQFKKDSENNDLEELTYAEQQNSERN